MYNYDLPKIRILLLKFTAVGPLALYSKDAIIVHKDAPVTSVSVLSKYGREPS